ncbi:MAG: hypothetical protein OEU26_09045 [Candidatus Tectomicrobia bacterium]|nr:hypothetical protein [Candidatus Tectomicrobia bacterium]
MRIRCGRRCFTKRWQDATRVSSDHDQSPIAAKTLDVHGTANLTMGLKRPALAWDGYG